MGDVSQPCNSGTGAAPQQLLRELRNQLLQDLTGLVFTVMSITLIKYTASLCIKSLLITNPLEVTITLCILYFALMYCKGV